MITFFVICRQPEISLALNMNSLLFSVNVVRKFKAKFYTWEMKNFF